MPVENTDGRRYQGIVVPGDAAMHVTGRTKSIQGVATVFRLRGISCRSKECDGTVRQV